jgi:4-hydroxyphenylpyruvate dioxygenase
MKKTLWPACVRSHPVRAQLAAAQAAGFTHLPIGLVDYQSLRREGLSAEDIRDLYDSYGVQIGHYDGFSDWAPVRYNADLPDTAKAVFAATSAECLDICSALGIDTICATGTFNRYQFEIPQLQDGFHQFCEQSASAGVRVDLEFLPMWGVNDLSTALAILGSSPPDNAGLLVDTWHFFRSGSTLKQLQNVPSGLIKTIQLADATLSPQADDLFEDCLTYRKLPGQGEFPLESWLKALAHQPIDNIGPEIFSAELDQLFANAAAQACYSATAQTLRDANWATATAF